MSRRARNVDDNNPARTSMTVTVELRHGVEDAHLVGRHRDIDDFAYIRMKGRAGTASNIK